MTFSRLTRFKNLHRGQRCVVLCNGPSLNRMDHHFAKSGAPNAPLHMRGADPNHFSPDYFRDQDWDAPNLAGSEESYRVAHEVFQTTGRRIVDATPEGGCTIFPKVDYRRVFGLVA